jgi:hypothetical protein
MATLALINGRLIDGTGKEPRDRWGLVVAGDRIQEVGASNSLRVPSDATVTDLGGRTIMPGLIDAHTHLTYHASEYSLILQQMNESLEINTVKAVDNARRILETGCTAIGDGGSRGHIATAIRDGVRQGLITGPKVVAAGQMISGSGGIGDHTAARGLHENETYLGIVVNGPQGMRAAVRRQMRAGADWVKVTASGTPGNLWITGRTQDLGFEEILAAVHLGSLTIRAMDGIMDAVRAGFNADRIGSNCYAHLPQGCGGGELRSERGTYATPTTALSTVLLHFHLEMHPGMYAALEKMGPFAEAANLPVAALKEARARDRRIRETVLAFRNRSRARRIQWGYESSSELPHLCKSMDLAALVGGDDHIALFNRDFAGAI